MNLSKKAKKNLNEHFGKLAPIAFSMFFVWFGNGIWHGASWKYVVYGLYYYLIMMIGLLFEPLARRLIAKAHINISLRGYRLWQMARTFLLVCFGMLIFRAKFAAGVYPVRLGFYRLRRGCFNFRRADT